MDATSEAQVVRWLVDHLVSGEPPFAVNRDSITVDRHPSYISSSGDQLERFYGIPRVAGRTADVLFATSAPIRAGRVIALEVKGSTSKYEKGLTQATEYRRGAHESYLCVPGQEDAVPSGVRYSAREAGSGILCVTADCLKKAVTPRAVSPEPALLSSTQRYLGERRLHRAFGLNYPLNYVAALISATDSSSPREHMFQHWGLKESSVDHAFNGAETLGLIAEDEPTALGQSYTGVFRQLGFTLSEHKTYSYKGRLVENAPGIASVLQTVYLRLNSTSLIVEVLSRASNTTLDLSSLAIEAMRIDEGTALALFGEPDPEEPWRPTPTTVYQFKQNLWHIGVLRTSSADGTKSLEKSYPEMYRPSQDTWGLDPRITLSA
jgi:hypothetical protein